MRPIDELLYQAQRTQLLLLHAQFQDFLASGAMLRDLSIIQERADWNIFNWNDTKYELRLPALRIN